MSDVLAETQNLGKSYPLVFRSRDRLRALLSLLSGSGRAESVSVLKDVNLRVSRGESLPVRYQGWFDFNPFAFYPEFFRASLLHSGAVTLAAHALALVIALTMLALGLTVFRRLDPHFEDFL